MKLKERRDFILRCQSQEKWSRAVDVFVGCPSPATSGRVLLTRVTQFVYDSFVTDAH
jgi:hypothetical protein